MQQNIICKTCLFDKWLSLHKSYYDLEEGEWVKSIGKRGRVWKEFGKSQLFYIKCKICRIKISRLCALF